MIGQERLKKQLGQYDVKSFPRTSLFIGPVGCGKHTAAKELANKFGLDFEEITDNISLDNISSIYENNVKKFYIIDLDKLTERHQNIILKFIEEPPSNIFVVLLSSSLQFLLPTIVNRCIKFTFNKYKQSELENFININTDDETLDIVFKCCETPGDLVNINYKILKDMNNLCINIYDKMNIASLSNTLSIAEKLNYKSNYDLYDVRLFLKLLLKLGSERLKSASLTDFKMIQEVNKANNKLVNSRLDKKSIIESMLFEMWRISHGIAFK